MSIQSRRNALFKSSISIKSIGDSIQKFSEGLRSARKNADETIKTSRQTVSYTHLTLPTSDLV